MRKTLSVAAAAALFVTLTAPVSFAGPIEKACMRSDRAGASRSVCRCIQEAADQTLRSGDQRRAAKFFADPDLAQNVRISTRSADDAFWDRYKNFAATAEAYCAG
jgi:hypothetical protein